MPLRQIFHPVDAYTTEDKQAFSERITSLYAQIPIPRIYVVTLFMPVSADSCFVGGVSHPKFVRFKIDQMARTLPGATLRGWWMRRIEEIIAPYVRERGFEWEVQTGELPSDLWTMNGFVPPPFQSIAEKRWVEDNATSAYGEDEKVPVNLSLAPGICD